MTELIRAIGMPAIKADYLYYNPEMIDVYPILKRLKHRNAIPVRDYQLIAVFASSSPGRAAILPSKAASRYSKLKQLTKSFYTTDICLIHRFDLPKTRASKEIQLAFSELGYKDT